MDYTDTRISPYEEFQLFKQTDFISSLLRRGERIEYGARTIYEGGLLGVCTYHNGMMNNILSAES